MRFCRAKASLELLVRAKISDVFAKPAASWNLGRFTSKETDGVKPVMKSYRLLSLFRKMLSLNSSEMEKAGSKLTSALQRRHQEPEQLEWIDG